MKGIDYIYHQTPVIEGHVFIMYLLEAYKKKIQPRELFEVIVSSWIEHIDHWITADHLCINVFPYIPITQHPYLQTIQEWTGSKNMWKRRLSIVAFIKHLKKNHEARTIALNNINQLIQDRSYYVRKAIPWVLRTISKEDPKLVSD